MIGKAMGTHAATICAYPIKDELGGGFRGVYFDRATKERFASDVYFDLEAARHWAKMEAHKRHEAQGYNLAPLNRRGEYQANVWTA